MSFPTTSTPASTLKVTGSAHGSSSIEPSPASTYGSSIASEVGNVQPMTPMNDVIPTGMASLTLSENSKSLEKAPISFGNPIDDDDVFTNDPKSKGKDRAAPKTDRVDEIREHRNWDSDFGSSVDSDRSSGSPSANRGRIIVKLPVRRSEEDSHQLAFQEYASDDGSYQNFELAQQHDAQAIYPPSSCVFVANLRQSETDEALEVAVTHAFRDYGTVYVKIRRDSKQMPFAFCQYTNDNNAERAIREGSGRLINGRACRVEKAKAHRLFFIERKYGPTITAQEAYSVLKRFGRINFCRPAAPIERTQYNLNEGVIVQYAMYNNGQAAMHAYRNDNVYKVRSMAGILSPSRGQFAPRTPDPALSRHTKLYDIDRRSIHVGNLSGDVTQAQIQEHFEQCGLIMRISINTGPSNISRNELYAFAFVEFELQSSADLAINLLNGSCLGGKVIRVSQKDNRQRRAHAGPNGNPGHVNTPIPQSSIQQQYFQTPFPINSYTGVGSPPTTHWTTYNGWYCYWFADAANGFYSWIPYCPVSSSPYNSPGSRSRTAGSPTGSPLAAQTIDSLLAAQTTGNPMSPTYVVPQIPAWNAIPEFVSQQQASPDSLHAPASPAENTRQGEDRSATPTPAGQATVEDCLESA